MKFTNNYHKLAVVLVPVLLLVLAVGVCVCNYAFADDERIEKAVVEKKYYKVHHKTRRVSRKRFTQGEPYNVYYMRVRLGNGETEEVKIDCNKYNRLHKGDTVTLSVSDGLFGIQVIKYDHAVKHKR